MKATVCVNTCRKRSDKTIGSAKIKSNLKKSPHVMDYIYLTALVKWKAMINLKVFRCYDFHSGKRDYV